MSGGAYEYLCWKTELDELLSRQHHLRNMADRLAGLGYAADAAEETEELLIMLRQWQIRAEVRVKRLEAVWKAVEWWDSADWGEDRVHAALALYRGDNPAQAILKANPSMGHPVSEAAVQAILKEGGLE